MARRPAGRRPGPTAGRLIVGAVAAAVAAGLTGCGQSPITGARVAAAVGPTFSNLYLLQQNQRGHPTTAAAMRTRATCARGGGSMAAVSGAGSSTGRGAGDDWACTIIFQVRGPQIPEAATYALHVRTDGCYSADGDGPTDLNGAPTLVDTTGNTVINPLWQFDGCFDTG
ncbi:MAG: hypothetical protein ACR2JQ_05150 [Mycobacteriales bacterium]